MLREAAEKDLVQWDLAMQKRRLPVGREMIIQKASEIHRYMFSSMHSVGSVGWVWCDQFMSRHGELTLGTAQVIKQARNGASLEGMWSFFCELCQHITKWTIKKEQLCNMDETFFIQKQNLRKLVVSKGSSNVWSKCADASFHMTFVVCVFAAKSVAPPLLIIPGRQLNRGVLEGFDIEGANITTAPKGFISYTLFLSWLEFFANSVLIQLRAHLSWFILSVADITMMKL